jgi:hypothetical protein
VKGRGWEKTYFDFLARDGKYRFTKRILVGLLPDHSSVTYYFDLSRPMNAMKRLFNLG